MPKMKSGPKPLLRLFAVLGLAAAAGMALPSGCASLPSDTATCTERTAQEGNETTAMAISRPRLYESEDELADDCDAILIGVVQAQEEANDVDALIPDTKATVQVVDTVKGDQPAASRIIVRQTGPQSMSVLAEGKTYLFYLNDFKTGADVNEYYVTGVTAGVYMLNEAAPQAQSDDAAPTFLRVDKASGDTLPREISLNDVG